MTDIVVLWLAFSFFAVMAGLCAVFQDSVSALIWLCCGVALLIGVKPS